MGEPVAARKGSESAPSEPPAPQNASHRSSNRKAPTEPPAPIPAKPRTGGDGNTPTSTESNIVPPIEARLSGKHAPHGGND